MAQDLKQYLAENPCKGFRSIPHYFPIGDYLTFYARDEHCYAERVDDLLTVFLSNQTGEMVGCKIHGVKQLLTALGVRGVVVASANLTLELFLVIGKSSAKDQDQRRRYDEAVSLVSDAAISRGEIVDAAP